MSVSQNRVTGKAVTGSVAASMKPRPITFVGPTDPRNNPAYLAKNPNIVVLNASDWAAWLKSHYVSTLANVPTNTASVTSAQVFDNTNISDPKNGQVDTTISPPTNLNWDHTFKTVATTDLGILQNITITFDKSVDDDGTFEYLVEYDAVPSNVAIPATAANASTLNQNVNQTIQNNAIVTASTPNISTPVTSNTLTIKFAKMANAVSYNIVIHGLNLPANTGSSAVAYSKVPSYSGYTKIYTTGSVYGKYVTSVSGSSFVFTLTQQNGYVFTGTYTATVQPNYASGSAGGITSAPVTI